jgi:phosphopentomutase
MVDARLGPVLAGLGDRDLLVITADHGNDPTDLSTDHTREFVPLLVAGPRVRGVDLGVRATFADVGATVAVALDADPPRLGESFLGQVVRA